LRAAAGDGIRARSAADENAADATNKCAVRIELAVIFGRSVPD